MRKWRLFLCSLVLVFALVGGARAAPLTYTDYINFNPDRYVSVLTPQAYTHDLKRDGFEPFHSLVYSYNLEVRLYDDLFDIFDKVEIAVVSQGFSSYQYDFSCASNVTGTTFFGLLSLNLNGTLDVLITADRGDFMLDWSKLTASAVGCSAVPEPGMLIFLGAGLTGLVVANRKRSLK